ncbi:MAG: EscU/YscU/HrcU family type III secretion system export apparatus switch protein, partial [Treponema sp.]|nr:EscU/YscU/HrcU family type III secretion system export apparatus switch protein [Treponema sp.]
MAAEDEGRTEEASEYKLEKARKEGRVAKSAEVSGALVLLFCVMTLIFLSKWLFNIVVQSFVYFFSRAGQGEMGTYASVTYFMTTVLKCMLPVSLVGIFAAIAGNIIQTRGFIFSLKPIEPKFSKIVPKFGEYLKKTIFSGKGLFNVAKSVGKVAIIIIIAYVYIKKDIFDIIQVIDYGDVFGAIVKFSKMAAQLLIIVSI